MTSGKRELLAGHTVDKAPVTDLAARFQSPIDAHEFAPARRGRFVGDQFSEHDAVTPQEEPAPVLDSLLVLHSGE